MANVLTGFFALGTGDGTAGFVELSGAPGYSRLPISLVTKWFGTCTNTTCLNFASNGGAWPTVTQRALYDGSGALLFWWNEVPFTLSDQRPAPIVNPGDLELTFPDSYTTPGRWMLQWPASTPVGTTRNGTPIWTAPSGTAWSAP